MTKSEAGSATVSSLYERLRAAILDGEFRPGGALAEGVLAEAYGVSRTPIREALGRLEHDGVLERRGRQLTIRETTPEEVLEIYDCRIVLEGMAAEWAANMRTDYDLASMARTHRAMAELTERSPSAMTLTNSAFHLSMWRGSHNSTLVDLLERLEIHIRRYPEPTVSQPGRWEQALDEHTALMQAIENRDAARARTLGADHMAAARDLRLSMIRSGLSR